MKLLPAILSASLLSTFFVPGDAWTKGAVESVIYSFAGDKGQYPVVGLVALNGILYGTSEFGGDGTCEGDDGGGCGTVYAIDPATGAATLIYGFENIGVDGSNPIGAVVTHGSGKLYGTTALGIDERGGGTIFGIDLTRGVEKVLYTFDPGGRFGSDPNGALIDVKGILYGTTKEGGGSGEGYVFSFDPKTGVETGLHAFSGGDGVSPGGSLSYSNGRIYGTTAAGGDNNVGVVFAVDIKSGQESTIYSFCHVQACSDGIYPNPGLIELNGKWYGTTSGGGARNKGTVFSINLKTGAEKVVHGFVGGAGDGEGPGAGLIVVGNKLYGTTGGGGNLNCAEFGCGTVFSVDPATGNERMLYAFGNDREDGQFPSTALLPVKGVLYGTTVYGGTYGYGTVFSIKP
jgi:uncharacterized repeat protein (TIGR03803 family)